MVFSSTTPYNITMPLTAQQREQFDAAMQAQDQQRQATAQLRPTQPRAQVVAGADHVIATQDRKRQKALAAQPSAPQGKQAVCRGESGIFGQQVIIDPNAPPGFTKTP